MSNEYVDYGVATSVSEAVTTRRSLRAFLPTAVDVDTLSSILHKAARAPSGTNIQPWNVYVVTDKAKNSLSSAVCAAFDSQDRKYQCEVTYYPEKWFEPYISRRRTVGWALYGLLGIEKGEREKTHAQHRRNFTFFDAPVGLFFTLHRDLATGSWLDYGMFLQNIMLLAREAGLHTCPQAAWADYHSILREQLPISSEEVVVCGMSLGYADPEAIENTLVTERESLDTFVRFVS